MVLTIRCRQPERNDITKPMIAAVNGYAFGGGFEIALCCDVVLADERAVFSMSEPRVGFVALGAARSCSDCGCRNPSQWTCFSPAGA
jgi:1,4-dihydroxy-2-naphthoyl-CoA synthase